MTPLKAIKQWCRDCGEGTIPAVKSCPHPECSLFPFRLGKRQAGQSARKAILDFCGFCMNGSHHEVKLCQDADCLFYGRRKGDMKRVYRGRNTPSASPPQN